ncbi:uncharacterized protein LOC131656854 isoform X2 [Vicia villosa]|uniref:uncharacterized protein LOC131656854 isoform X2 n=1 Tax=Vicia villosa TaxID=3911 RepID=UPI00273BCBE1|nr:uncharacterized protein LOC131656854 isoform X2 [Vicia villosa]
MKSNINSIPNPNPTSFGLEPELDNDLDDLDEDENIVYDDEQWQVKSSIGLNSTLDFENSAIFYLFSDVFIVLLCSLATLGLLFQQMTIQDDRVKLVREGKHQALLRLW